MKKLQQIQQELKAPKNQYNSFGKYKYRSCEDILEAVKPLLGEATLVLSDEIKEAGSIIYCEATAILREENEEVVVKASAGIDPSKKGMDISQSFGSSSSYARKYALNGLFLIDDTKDADPTNDHGAKKATLKEGTPEYEKVVKGIANGYTIEQVKTKFNVSKELEEKLKAL
jgi:hypothetical protein